MLGPAVLPPSVPCLSRVRSALHFPAMHPHNKAPRLALLTAPNAPAAHTAVSCRRPETGLWATPFEYCGAVCRTTARSTQHENAFILDRRHCFSQVGAGCGALAAGMGCCAAAAPYTTCCAAVLHSTAICHCDGAWISINHALTSPTNPPTHPGTHPPTHPQSICSWAGRTWQCRRRRRCPRASRLWRALEGRPAMQHARQSRWAARRSTLPA